MPPKCRANGIATLATLGVNELTHCFKHNSNPKNKFNRPRNKTNEENLTRNI